ncbi:class A beta-lactamase [Streptomyces sp. NPDC059134]|uniref:class A beta-lactamase n=1 Tax=Streptomyces sp. NPDC059134 TaxID=3346738 RepID=UPI0036B7035E
MRDVPARRIALGTLVLTLLPLTACGGAESAAGAREERTRTVASVSDLSGADVSGSRASSGSHASGLYDSRFKKLESKFDARLGVYALDTGTNRELAFRADERFAYCSTFKALQAGAVLKKHKLAGMGQRINYTEDDMVPDSPVTKNHVDTGMTVGELADASVRHSDNTAANLLFDTIGGPSGLGAFLKTIGDDVTQVDRYEPDLNEATPGDTRDTSTPRALAKDLRSLVLGDVLGKEEKALLTKWLTTNVTGANLIAAGMPDGWTVGDKSGGGRYGTRNDIAVVWPDQGAPIVVAVMSTRDEPDATRDDALVAGAASVVADAMDR